MRSLLVLSISLAACATAGKPDRISVGGGGGNDGPDAAMTAPPGDGTSSSGCGFTGVLASYSFAAEPGSQPSTAAGTTAPGVTAGDFARAPSLTAATGASSMNSSNWAMGAQRDDTKYYALTLTAPAGCSLALTSIAVDVKTSSTGPAQAEIATSADSFSQSASIATASTSTATLSATASGMLEVRFYGYSASGAAGTMRVQNTLTLTGAIQ